MTRTFIHEATPGGLGEVTEKGIVPLVIASPGWGSSGWYGAKVLENAATAKVFGKDLHLYMDHPSESEQHDRPERSVRDLVAVLAEDARWDSTRGLMAEAKIFKPYRDLFRDEDFVKAIGVSLRAYADTTVGEAEGRKGTIITELLAAESVDFVTKAGRGGMVLSALESARTRVDEATSNDTREALNAALRAAYGAEDVWLWLRDFDDTTAWFTREDADSSAIYQQAYALADDGTAVLAEGDPIEVRARTEYVPVTPAAESGTTKVPAPAGQSTATESEGDDMATTQIEESRLAQLEKDAERVQSLESDNAAAVERAEKAERDLALYRTREAARPAVARTVAESGLPARRQTRLVESVLGGVQPDTTPEAVVEATKKAVADEQADIAELAESLGVGAVRGFGQTVAESTGYSVEGFDAAFSTSQEG